ncbi:MAG: aminotransferase class I/II-fold pyridoxal phosphate-dependent enzyme [Tepidisphaerales bacterium]
MKTPRLDDLLGEALAQRAASQLLRARPVVERVEGPRVRIDGREYVNFASNDYLGLSRHPRVVEAARDAAAAFGAGAAASPLITGYTPVHAAAERTLADWKGTESAVLLPSGYQTSHAIVQTLAGVAESHMPGLRFLLDKLAHASLVDAVQASGASFRIFPHNHLEKLSRLLADAPAGKLQVVVTESIYSMDGDAAPLKELAGLREQFGFIWLLDEAHGSGVYGQAGRGLAHEQGVAGSVDIHMVTLSKALGVAGGAACASRRFCESLVNWGRAYVYSTAVAPPVAGAIPAAVAVLRDEPRRQQRVRRLAVELRRRLTQAGIKLPDGDSPIIPIALGTESAAIAAAAVLKSRGLWVQPIRPPTVPRGTSRLRITLSCEHGDEDVARLLAGLRQACAGGSM